MSPGAVSAVEASKVTVRRCLSERSEGSEAVEAEAVRRLRQRVDQSAARGDACRNCPDVSGVWIVFDDDLDWGVPGYDQLQRLGKAVVYRLVDRAWWHVDEVARADR